MLSQYAIKNSSYSVENKLHYDLKFIASFYTESCMST